MENWVATRLLRPLSTVLKERGDGPAAPLDDAGSMPPSRKTGRGRARSIQGSWVSSTARCASSTVKAFVPAPGHKPSASVGADRQILLSAGQAAAAHVAPPLALFLGGETISNRRAASAPGTSCSVISTSAFPRVVAHRLIAADVALKAVALAGAREQLHERGLVTEADAVAVHGLGLAEGLGGGERDAARNSRRTPRSWGCRPLRRSRPTGRSRRRRGRARA